MRSHSFTSRQPFSWRVTMANLFTALCRAFSRYVRTCFSHFHKAHSLPSPFASPSQVTQPACLAWEGFLKGTSDHTVDYGSYNVCCCFSFTNNIPPHWYGSFNIPHHSPPSGLCGGSAWFICGGCRRHSGRFHQQRGLYCTNYWIMMINNSRFIWINWVFAVIIWVI